MAWDYLCWILLLLAATHHTAASVPIISNVEDQKTVNDGQYFEAPCSGSSTLEWMYQRPASKRVRSVAANLLRGSGNKLVLTITKVEKKHVGKYICRYKNGGNSSSFYLFVKGSSSPFFETKLYDVKEGEDASGLCPLSDSDVTGYTIRRFQASVLPKGFEYETNIENGITIKNVQTNFDGSYICTVYQNNVLKKSNNFRLMVTPVFKKVPRVFLTKSKLLVKAGEPFEVTCVVNDVNAVEAKWTTAPSMTVTEKGVFHSLANFTRNSTLRSQAVQLNESGIYTCQGKNSIGLVNVTFTLEVIEFGYINLAISDNTTVDVNAGDNLVLRVYIDAYPRPDEEYWTCMNETLQNTSDHFVETRDEGNNRYVSELHLIRLKGNERGVYTFYSSNSDANASISFNIFVKTKPEILIAERLSNGMVQCVAAGFPLPSIKWLFCPGTEQGCVDSPAFDMKVSQENSSLGRMVVESTIDVSSIKKNGTVHCIASNDVETTSSVFSFAIKDTNTVLGR